MESSMPAYIVFIMRTVKEPAALERYWESVGPTLAGRPIKPLAAYTPFTVLEGVDPVEAAIVVEFPSREDAEAWYNSPGYQSAREHRLAGADFLTLLIEGGAKAPRHSKMVSHP